MTNSLASRLRMIAIAVILGGCAPIPSTDAPGNSPKNQSALADPIEPVNRAVWKFNHALVMGVLDPLSAAYISVVPQPIRKRVGNVGDNLGGPSRILNQALQGRWSDSGSETLRFLTNSTVGVAGIFDPASEIDLPANEGTFNQTFRHWGMRPANYLVLPGIGPSDEIHALGSLCDIAADPSNYIAELAAARYATRLHRLSEITPAAAGMFRSEPDSYSLGKQAGPYIARTTEPNWALVAPPDPATLQSLNAALARLKDPLFVHRARTGRAQIESTGKRLPFSYWMQDKPAPVVFLSPGVGSHRLSANTLVLAENIYGMGYSVVSISGVFHPEFLEHASTAPLPGNPVWDRADLLAAWTAVDSAMACRHGRKVTKRILAGFSLGGFMAMQLAATEEHHAEGSVSFDRYVAIQSPVDLRHAYTTLDDYADVPNRWSEEIREQRIDRVFHKAVAIFNGGPPPGTAPFDGDESKFLVGYSFRRVLRDAIFSLQQRGRCGGLGDDGSKWRRSAVYDRLMALRFDEYHHDWLLPAEQKHGMKERAMDGATSLHQFGAKLQCHPGVRLIENRNDFLMSELDRQWVERHLNDRTIWLEDGGHLGNLSDKRMTDALRSALEFEESSKD